MRHYVRCHEITLIVLVEREREKKYRFPIKLETDVE
jgi:hypothetical protein